MPLTAIEELLNDLTLVDQDSEVEIIRALFCELDSRIVRLEKRVEKLEPSNPSDGYGDLLDKLELKIAERKAWEVGPNSVCHYPECEKPASCVVQDTSTHTEPGSMWVNRRPFGPAHFYCEEHDRQSQDVDFTS